MPKVEFISPKWECSRCHSKVEQPVRVVDGKLKATFFYLPQKCPDCGKLLDFYKVLEHYDVETIKKANKVLV
ncbi:MAG: hypothetical protein A2Z86_11470 [Candidatus Glassbacteria bacterium GWA2_58_10]|uniref:Uncharacterized protein n=1 Tax=Candidatus Glassbacteria bacterium GWA2_58_10 TaxID=1817865 RepID=A0A1F5YEZ3_9BACT|nr:MAG: hypothetical protein A2Z86_11470 [Candidatus Glassbacteria bacterium GWA2_58_10]